MRQADRDAAFSAEDLLQISLTKLYVAWPRVQREAAQDSYARRIIVNSHIDEPEHGADLSTHLRTGRRALSRRRLATSAGAMAAVAVLGAATWVASGGDDSARSDRCTATRSAEPAEGETTATPQDPGEAFAAECRSRSGEVLWEAGDRRYWARCSAYGGEPPYATGCAPDTITACRISHTGSREGDAGVTS